MESVSKFDNAAASRTMRGMLHRFACVGLVLLGSSSAFAREEKPIYKDVSAPLEKRVDDLLGRLTEEEKFRLFGGEGFYVPAIPRLGVPDLAMVDAGQGVRGGREDANGPATAFPAAVAMAATWDRQLIRDVGHAIAEEARNKGRGSTVLLGPAVNIHRTPLGGRYGEYFSEDPYLAAHLTVPYIDGVQSAGVAACVKHFACNNQEFHRDDINEHVGERALREIYLPAFEAAVKDGHAWAVMSAYNQINNAHCSANSYLLRDVLKTGWGFDGVVMSDWGGVHEVGALAAGNDLEMPWPRNYSADRMSEELVAGRLTQAQVDDSARRILRTIIRTKLLDAPLVPDASMVMSKAHADIAYRVATEGIVLLKNDRNILPLEKGKSIALIGDPARTMQYDALGSPFVEAVHPVELIDALATKLGTKRESIRFATGRAVGEPITADVVTAPGGEEPGFRAEYFDNVTLSGSPALTRTEREVNLEIFTQVPSQVSRMHFSARWTGTLKPPTSGEYTLTFNGDDGYRLFVDDKQLVNQWQRKDAISSVKLKLEAGKSYALRIELNQVGGDVAGQLTWTLPDSQPFADAVALAKQSDVAIVCVSTGRAESEGNDRLSMDLPNKQADLIRAVAAANPKTIVILNNGGPVLMRDWLANVAGVVESFFPGQEGGRAIADVLFGDVNPSGKLPDTIAARREDYPDFKNYPGDKEVNYAEGIYVGYRHFDKAKIEPLFPFGFGLSYTTFEYSNLRQGHDGGGLSMSVDVKNTGTRPGVEIAQLYIGEDSPTVIDKPVQELKGFERVTLQPGESKTVTFELHPRDLAYFDVAGKKWVNNPGAYEVRVGGSSRAPAAKTTIHIDQAWESAVPDSKSFYEPTAKE